MRWTSRPCLAGLCAGLLLAACAAGDPGAGTEAATAPPEAEPTPTVEPADPMVEPEPHDEAAGDGGDCQDPVGCYGEPRRVGVFDAGTVPENSGLATSVRNPGLVYLLDDRPGTSEVWALDVDLDGPSVQADDVGELIGPIPIAGLDAADTEALALGSCGDAEGASCLYVGDIGDNLRAREAIDVHRVVEPDLSAGAPADPLPADVARLRYPDGPHDAEALLVDEAGVPLIVTKAPFDPDTGETGQTRLYQAPGFADGTLADRGEVPVPEPSEALHSQFVGNVVTGGEAFRGNGPPRVLLRTYDQVVEFVADDADADLTGFPTWEHREVPAPFEPQSESISWAPDGCGYLTAGEQVGDVWYVPCEPEA